VNRVLQSQTPVYRVKAITKRIVELYKYFNDIRNADTSGAQTIGTVLKKVAYSTFVNQKQIVKIVVAFTLHEQRLTNTEGGYQGRISLVNNVSLCLLCQEKSMKQMRRRASQSNTSVSVFSGCVDILANVAEDIQLS
jgi:hypothetical protein